MRRYWAERYLGIPWRTGGRTTTGLDCWGLLVQVYRQEFGIQVNPFAVPLGHIASHEEVSKVELGNGSWIELENFTHAEDGDGVALGRNGRFSHVGIYVKNPEPSMIHTAHKLLSHIETIRNLREKGWDTIKFYRHASRPQDR